MEKASIGRCGLVVTWSLTVILAVGSWLRVYMIYMGHGCTGHVVDRVSAGGPRVREGKAITAAAGIEAHDR